MTQAAPQTCNLRPALILFGNDQAGRLHAGWFTADDLVVAERASGALGYVALRLTGEDDHAVARLLPRGHVHFDHQIEVPLLSPELFESLRSLISGNQPRSGPPAPAVPASEASFPAAAVG